MRLVIASDFAGFTLKEAVKRHLLQAGHDIADVGQQTADEQIIYVEAVERLVGELLSGSRDKGIVMCGTGAGVSIAANKHKGIYCVPCESLFTAPKSAIINNANVLAMGSRVIAPEHACEIADSWLQHSFCKGFAPERTEFVSSLFAELQKMEAEQFK